MPHMWLLYVAKSWLQNLRERRDAFLCWDRWVKMIRTVTWTWKDRPKGPSRWSPGRCQQRKVDKVDMMPSPKRERKKGQCLMRVIWILNVARWNRREANEMMMTCWLTVLDPRLVIWRRPSPRKPRPEIWIQKAVTWIYRGQAKKKKAK